MSELGLLDAALLIGGGLVAGFVNTLAGGGSFLTVPLLIFVGLPATVANATNRVGVLIQNLSAVAGFRREGVRETGQALRILPVALLGSWLGALAASHISDAVFGPLFGAMMLLALPVIVWNPKPRAGAARALPLPVQWLAYLAIGFYGGAVQAGIGIPLALALVAVGGLDLVRANSVKVVVIAAVTAIALAQFAWADKIVWLHGLVLAVGTGVGGYLGGRFGARVGDRLIRPVMSLAVIAMALRLLAPLFI